MANARRFHLFATVDALTLLASSGMNVPMGPTAILNVHHDCSSVQQVHVILAKLDNGAVSHVYAFLPGKVRQLYA